MNNKVLKKFTLLLAALAMLALPISACAEEGPAEAETTAAAETAGEETYMETEAAEIPAAETSAAEETLHNEGDYLPGDETEGQDADVPEAGAFADPAVQESQPAETEPVVFTLEELSQKAQEQEAVNERIEALEEENHKLLILFYICIGVSTLSVILAIVAMIVGARDPARADVGIVEDNLQDLQKTFQDFRDITKNNFEATEQQINDLNNRV